MDISIIIPVFEESKKIAADINAASQFLKNNNLTGEIIIADDGSKDGTAQVAQSTPVPPKVTLKVVRSEHNRGKGHALRSGITQSSGQYVMFADCGCCVPYSHVLEGLKLLQESSCDIAHASRKLAASKIHRHQPLRRRFCSTLFRQVMIYFMQMPHEITDSQCGFKIYNGNVAHRLYGKCITDGFMFDIEIILRAKKQNYRITEFPVEWTCDRDSRLSLSRSFLSVLRELLDIKRALAKDKQTDKKD
jgi:dolichyl-phosphate beta-glucosyltransferase